MTKYNEYFVSVNEYGSIFWREGHWHGSAFFPGDRHRVEGPAIEFDNGEVEYWLHGERVTKEEHERLTAKPKKMTVAEVSKALGYKVEIV